MRPLKFIVLAGTIGLTFAQNTQTAQCIQDPRFNWMSNSLHQDPCLMAEYLGGACNNGVFHIPPLNTSQEYIGPTQITANPCRCSSPFFSLLSACAQCQLAQTITWTEYDANCSAAVFVGVFPRPIPAGTAIPHWAFLDVSLSDGFNATAAQLLSSGPESTPVNSATSTSTLTAASDTQTASGSSNNNSNAGPIAGGVVGGVFFIALVVIIVMLILRRRKPTTAPAQSVFTTSPHPETNVPAEYQPYPMASSPTQRPLLYNPSDPRTFPASTPPVSRSPNSAINPVITGSSLSTAPTSGAYYPGVAEV